MRATILTDNTASEPLLSEWGLSVFIEQGEEKILLDAGQSAIFLENAKQLGIDLKTVDYAVLSHAHFDHSDGLPAFLDENPTAPLYIRAGSREDCWSRSGDAPHYIGIRKGFLRKYAARIRYAAGRTELGNGVTLLPHASSLKEKGKKAGMERRYGPFRFADDFSHEQSLVIDTPSGLVIFNSCSHGGADTILEEVAAAFPGKQIAALVGGLHLYRTSESDVRALCRRMDALGIRKVLTGHCTGDDAFRILQEELGDRVEAFCVGKTISF